MTLLRLCRKSVIIVCAVFMLMNAHARQMQCSRRTNVIVEKMYFVIMISKAISQFCMGLRKGVNLHDLYLSFL